MREGPLLEQVAVESLTLETLLNAVERAARAVEGKRYAFKLQEKFAMSRRQIPKLRTSMLATVWNPEPWLTARLRPMIAAEVVQVLDDKAKPGGGW